MSKNYANFAQKSSAFNNKLKPVNMTPRLNSPWYGHNRVLLSAFSHNKSVIGSYVRLLWSSQQPIAISILHSVLVSPAAKQDTAGKSWNRNVWSKIPRPTNGQVSDQGRRRKKLSNLSFSFLSALKFKSPEQRYCEFHMTNLK